MVHLEEKIKIIDSFTLNVGFMKKYQFLFLFFIITQHLFSQNNQDEYRYLDDLALKAGADKASNYHNYTEIYARYFAPLKDKPIKFLEIGIWKGYSVKLWEEYFKNADLYFFDVTFSQIEYYSQRSHYLLANQDNAQDLQNAMAKTGGDFDVIIDDGGHTMNQQIVSFQTLFPYVKKGGMYIIEDLHTSYWREFGGGGKAVTTVNYLKSLIDEINFVGVNTRRASHLDVDPAVLKKLNLYREQIESIHFYDSVAIIIKR